MSAETDTVYKTVRASVPVVEVVVMEDRARVVRRAEVALAKGLSRVRTEGVAPVASDKTLVGRLAGGGARILESRITREVRTTRELPPEDPAALREKLTEMNLQFRNEGITESLLQSEINELDHAEELAAGDVVFDVAWSRADLGAWRGRFDAIAAKRRALATQLDEVRDAMERIRLEMERLERVAGATGTVTSETVVALECDIEVETPGKHEITFEYTVPAACWRPYHTAELTRGERGARVAFRTEGCVWQNTGEDWNEVRLVFSTERPSLGAEPPRLSSDVIALQPKQEEVVVEARDQAVQTAGLGTTGKKRSSQLPGVDDGGEARVMRARDVATVLSDGRPCRVEIFSFEADAEASYVSIPELAASVILQSVQPNEAEFPLLAGPVDLIRDSGLVGRTSIKFVAPDERFTLGWGPDSELRVRRETETAEEESGLLSSWITSRRTVTVRLSNIGAESRTLKLTERIPVSEIDQVEIEFDKKATTRGATPDADGMLTWDVTLPPFGREKITLGFTVKKKKGVVGI